MGTKVRNLASHLEALPDPRSQRGQRHVLQDIVLIAVLAVLCGADSWEDIHRFAKSQDTWLKTFLSLPHGVPSADTISRVFMLLDPKAFAECFLAWVRDVRKKVPGDVVALDGKTLRASFAAGKSALHMVSAWSEANGMVLGQVAVDQKSNEITAIPALLKVLDLKGCIVTIDAMGCQKDIAKAIVARKAQYVLAVKGNQERLHKAIQACFERLDSDPAGTAHGSAESVDMRRGRNERRQVTTLDAVTYLPEDILLEWPKLETIVRVRAVTTRGGKTATEERFYITPLSWREPDAIGLAVRSHWGIENKLHWLLDVTFREDTNRTRKGNGPECSAVLRHIVLNLLRQDPKPMGSIKFRRLQAAMSQEYRMAALLGFPQCQEGSLNQ